MNSLKALACACATSGINSRLSGFAADPYESSYDHGKVSFELNPNIRGGITVSQRAMSALGKLFQKTYPYFTKADNDLFDEIIWYNTGGIQSRLTYLILNPTNMMVAAQPVATVANLRTIKRLLLSDWRNNRIWFTSLFGSRSLQATVTNLNRGTAMVSPSGQTMSAGQVLTMLKMNRSDGAVAPERVDTQVMIEVYTAKDDPSGVTGKYYHTPQYPGQQPFGGSGVNITTAQVRATRHRYAGFSGFGGFAATDPVTALEQTLIGEGKDLSTSFADSQLDSSTGYYVDKALGVAFDTAGNLIGQWNGKQVTAGGKPVTPPSALGGGTALAIGGGLLAAILLMK